ncbi:MAG: hypothetical protein RLZZ416_165 [Candidatus Parcubacteria bacterium]
MWQLTTRYRQRPGGDKELHAEVGTALPHMLATSSDKINANEKKIRETGSSA